MNHKRLIIIFWILFLVPTVLISVLAFQLLSHEQERINRQIVLSLEDRIRSIAQTIHVTIESVEDRFSQSLLKVKKDDLKKTLLFWERTNPLVRNIFIWESSSNLVYPLKGMESTSEERRFITRYDSLFSGRFQWGFDDNILLEELYPENIIADDKESLQVQTKSKYKASRNKLYDLAKGGTAPQTVAEQESLKENKHSFKAKSGWIPWFDQNSLCILGWVKQLENGPVYGIELELMTMLSSIVVDLPSMNKKGAAYALVDGKGQILFQSGDFPIDSKNKADISIVISDLLPHWRLNLFINENILQSNQSFLYISVILLAVFIIAILSGGALLTWQALLKTKDAMQKTSFVSSVSHELKTPLTSIRMYAELLLSGRVKDKEKTAHYLDVIVTESQRLTRLVNNVLDFGRLEQGKKKYNIDSFDLVDFLNEIIEAHKIRIQAAGIKVNVIVSCDTNNVESDRDALEQVVLNLIDNVLKYACQAGSMSFFIEAYDRDYIDLKICDKGPGIPKEHQKLIFEKFHRVDNSLTSKQPGSGLGLSISKKILQDLHGDLLFEDKKPGSCFTARIRKNG